MFPDWCHSGLSGITRAWHVSSELSGTNRVWPVILDFLELAECEVCHHGLSGTSRERLGLFGTIYTVVCFLCIDKVPSRIDPRCRFCKWTEMSRWRRKGCVTRSAYLLSTPLVCHNLNYWWPYWRPAGRICVIQNCRPFLLVLCTAVAGFSWGFSTPLTIWWRDLMSCLYGFLHYINFYT